ncbi:hypothetical protein K6U06_06465 [Acidiferrimicrobium sp. IK]|uniref:hypothetical protein n=1 Tax=Acidiferrimicrobium sp. IK TaxID=2871700 RepID=UPI0021CAF429|nr:hypothetical protein [Acidiferrimicrobium sp. IK]MCU4183996.1 hypothetical protein [Acidiferrimicrobium sp. IK]
MRTVDLGAGLVDIIDEDADPDPAPDPAAVCRLDVIVAPDGSRWPTRCGCDAHPHRGHDATPLPAAATDDTDLVEKLRRAGHGDHTAKMIARDRHAYPDLIRALP